MHLFAQNNLDTLLDEVMEEDVEYITGTFKSTRVINLHSIEKVGPQMLDFRISHRFGSLDGGAYELFGLDQATMRLGLEYGINHWLMIGLGRSTYEKTFDGFIKALIIRQSKGKFIMPVSIAYLAANTVSGLKWIDPERENYFSSRMAFVHQLIIGSKINNVLSLQISPTLVHNNLVKTVKDQNTNYALGFSGRVKLTNRTTFNGEYIIRIPPHIQTKTYTDFYNSLSAGVDIETGGHVFSLHVSNSLPMIEKGFIMETNKSWMKRGIHFGFNISREFALKKQRKE